MDYIRDEHRVHVIVYHLVWTPKRRRPVLTGKVANRCKEIINAKCEEKGIPPSSQIAIYVNKELFQRHGRKRVKQSD